MRIQSILDKITVLLKQQNFEIDIQFSATFMQKNETDFQTMLKAAVFGIERARNERMTHKRVAEEIGVTKRVFDEWMRGAYAPAAVSAVLKLICLLPDDAERARLLSIWDKAQKPDGTTADTRPDQEQSSATTSTNE